MMLAKTSPFGILLTSFKKNDQRRRLLQEFQCQKFKSQIDQQIKLITDNQNELEKSENQSLENKDELKKVPNEIVKDLFHSSSASRKIELQCFREKELTIEVEINNYKTHFEMQIIVPKQLLKDPLKPDENQNILCYQFKSFFGENNYSYFECVETEPTDESKGDELEFNKFLEIISTEVKKMLRYIESRLTNSLKLVDVQMFVVDLISEKFEKKFEDPKPENANLEIIKNYPVEKKDLDLLLKIVLWNENTILMSLESKTQKREFFVPRFGLESTETGEIIVKFQKATYLSKQYRAELESFFNDLVEKESAKIVSFPMFIKLVDNYAQLTAIRPKKEENSETSETGFISLEPKELWSRKPVDFDSFSPLSSGGISSFENIHPSDCIGSLPEALNNDDVVFFGDFFGSLEVSKFALTQKQVTKCSDEDKKCNLINVEVKKTINEELYANTQKILETFDIDQNLPKNYVELAYLIPEIHRLVFIKVWMIESNFFEGFLVKFSHQFTKSEFLIPAASLEQTTNIVELIEKEIYYHYYKMIHATMDSKPISVDIDTLRKWVDDSVVKLNEELTQINAERTENKINKKLCTATKDEVQSILVFSHTFEENSENGNSDCPSETTTARLDKINKSSRVFQIDEISKEKGYILKLYPGENDKFGIDNAFTTFEIKPRYEYNFEEVFQGFLTRNALKMYGVKKDEKIEIFGNMFGKAAVNNDVVNSQIESKDNEIISDSIDDGTKSKIESQNDNKSNINQSEINQSDIKQENSQDINVKQTTKSIAEFKDKLIAKIDQIIDLASKETIQTSLSAALDQDYINKLKASLDKEFSEEDFEKLKSTSEKDTLADEDVIALIKILDPTNIKKTAERRILSERFEQKTRLINSRRLNLVESSNKKKAKKMISRNTFSASKKLSKKRNLSENSDLMMF